MRKLAAVPAIVTIITALAAVGCSGGHTTVTGKHKCSKDGKPAYCVTESTGHVIYVPLRTYNNTHVGDDVEGTSEHPSVSHPVEDPVDVHPVIVDGGR